MACSDGGGEADKGSSKSALHAASCPSVQPIPARSLFVTDAAALAKFPFETVMNRIVATGSTTGQTALSVFQQMMDTLNTQAGAKTQGGPHCDDVKVGEQGSINGFPIECPRAEGRFATSNPFAPAPAPDGYEPVGLVNRFDLAPQSGANCGQHRIVYAKRSGKTSFSDRLLFIFEATLPNPNPSAGIAGCLPVAEFWANLSTDDDTNSRATKLADFYFTGLPGFEPVVKASHYGFDGGVDTGQIRANLFSTPAGQPLVQWQLREFRLSQQCTSGDCSLVAKNTFVQVNPFGGLFGGGDSASAAFQNAFLNQVSSLASTNVNTIGMSSNGPDNAGQSNEQDTSNDYLAQAQNNATFKSAITSKLAEINRTDLTADDILNRATTQSCAGCHQVSAGRSVGAGITWPKTLGFVQIGESSQLSPALTETFLPFRAQVLSSFIDSQCSDAGPSLSNDGNNVDPKRTIGGGLVGAAN
ncbi:hypothetical protein LZC95_08540 [Pendulispora brunnea]|uniref:Cytochrome c domain-containing protein n=1 Tax=Pendulispora brunnea TaxID=2905690 RepID=A0ABZ2KDW0_9BACT